MQFHWQWSRVIFRPSIFWSLVAIELLFFATAVHSLAARFYRTAPGVGATEIADPADLPATEDISTDPVRLTTGATPAAATSPDLADRPPGALAWERIYGDYTLRCYSGGFTNDDYGEAQFEIWQRDTLVYSNSSHSFTPPEEEVADAETVPEWQLPPPGTDLTGRGQPDVVIAEYSGGAHCCSTYHIFELGDTFREVAALEAEHGDVEFVDLDGDGVPEVKMQDWSYAYEFTCFAGSYAPEIVLRFVEDHYVIAPDLMETPAWTEEELADKAAEIQAAYREVAAEGAVTLLSPADWGTGDGELWNAMLELIYAGHEDQALQLFNLAWPEWAEDRESALQHFSETVGASPYWQQLVAEPGRPVE